MCLHSIIYIVLTPLCGDGKKGDSEACDDNNTIPDDGCSSICTIEMGWNCTVNNCTSSCQILYLLDLNQFDGPDNLNYGDRILYETTEYLIDNSTYHYILMNNSKVSKLSLCMYRSHDFVFMIVG